MRGFARICIFLGSLCILAITSNAGQLTRVLIGQDAQLVCDTKTEEIRWTQDGKNITKGSNKRFLSTGRDFV